MRTRAISLAARRVDSPRVIVPSDVLDHEGEALGGRREHPALDPQEAPGLLDPLGEAAGHVHERGDDEVADGVVAQLGALLEAVGEDLGEAPPARHRHEAVAHVPGRGHAELPAQAAARPPVVGHGDDRGRQVPVELAQALEEHGQARAAAEGHDARQRWGLGGDGGGHGPGGGRGHDRRWGRGVVLVRGVGPFTPGVDRRHSPAVVS